MLSSEVRRLGRRDANNRHYLTCAPVSGIWAITGIGLHNYDPLDVSADNGTVLSYRAGDNHPHVLRDSCGRFRTVARLTGPRAATGRRSVAILEPLEGVGAGPTAHRIVLRPL